MIGFLLAAALAAGEGQVAAGHTTARLNLRLCGAVSEECRVFRTLPLETELEITERRGDWLEVMVRETGERGWVHGDYVRLAPVAKAPVAKARRRASTRFQWVTPNGWLGLLFGVLALFAGMIFVVWLEARMRSGGLPLAVVAALAVAAGGVYLSLRTGWADSGTYAVVFFAGAVIGAYMEAQETPRPQVSYSSPPRRYDAHRGRSYRGGRSRRDDWDLDLGAGYGGSDSGGYDSDDDFD